MRQNKNERPQRKLKDSDMSMKAGSFDIANSNAVLNDNMGALNYNSGSDLQTFRRLIPDPVVSVQDKGSVFSWNDKVFNDILLLKRSVTDMGIGRVQTPHVELPESIAEEGRLSRYL
eukprot:TRINITY_DN14738_c0_g1_i1.p2 TRINITY_DN14738_c0_g1~~TRINITY_DN14738_c0_g1_i1.p2  ORF type:complete len:117 (-),score=4.95 TRINITY_DN14738_c0_g1_i1:161-511(-)